MAEGTISLKLVLDTKANKVLYAEAENQFVDFLFYILSIPVGNIGNLFFAGKEHSFGSITDLYKSFETLSSYYFLANCDRSSIVSPHNTIKINPLFTRSINVNGYGFVKGLATYMVTDNLVVREVQIGNAEALALLKATFKTREVLTTVFLTESKIKSEAN